MRSLGLGGAQRAAVQAVISVDLGVVRETNGGHGAAERGARARRPGPNGAGFMTPTPRSPGSKVPVEGVCEPDSGAPQAGLDDRLGAVEIGVVDELGALRIAAGEILLGVAE